MTRVPQGFDFSFLNDHEAWTILQVLERNEELQRAEKDRISKLQKTKRDIRWLQGVTGEWFEEIQRKKFCNETDVSQMLKQPLTYRLRKGMAENDPMELQASRSKTTPNQRNSTAVPSRLSFKSSLASLFSFRKSRKDLKLQSLGQKGSDGHAGPPVSMRGAPPQTKLYNSTLRKQVVGSAFVPKPVGMREGGGLPPGGASLLEFFQVLDDLDSKLAEEQSSNSVTTEMPLNYGSRTQFGHLHPSENRHGSMTGRQKNRYNETSNMSIYDILRPGTPREGFKTFSPRTRTIYDMYRTREPRVSKEDYVPKNTFGSTSLCLDSRQRSASQAPGHFTARSLYFPGTAGNKSGFILPSHQQSPKRTPLSSIIWNISDPSEDRQNQKEFLNETSPMDVDPDHPSVYPRCFQESTRYEFYHSQNVYQNVNFHMPMDNAMSSDPFENSENMPFYPPDNAFARSFFSNTFGRSREQRFRQNPFWGQPEAHSPWSDFRREPFTSSDRDFEMTSMEADGASSIQNHSVSSQHWESFSYSYRTDISRNQEELHPWHFGSETSTLENMEVSQDHGDQATLHFDTPDVFSTTGSSYHIKSGGSEFQPDSYPREVPINKEPYSFGMSQSSFNTSLPQTSGGKRNSPSSNFQNPKVTLQKVVPSKPVSVPIRSYTEVTVTNSDSVDYLPHTESQPSVTAREVNNDKDLHESNLEKDKELRKMGQMSMTGEIQHPVSQMVDSPRLPSTHSPLFQNSAKNNSFVFSAPSTVSSRRSPRIHPKKDNPRIYTSHRNKSNELKKDKTWTENRKFSSAISLPLRTSSFPTPNQSCHQERTVNNEDISGTLQNNPWSSNRTGNPKALSLEEPNREEQWITAHSSNSSESAASQNSTYESPVLPILPTSSPVNDSSSDTLMSPSTTVFPRRSPSGPYPFLRGREGKDSDSKNQNNQFVPNSSENQKRNDSCRPLQGETMDAVQDSSHSPLMDRRGKGKIRRHISYIESLSKKGSKPTPGRERHNLMAVNENNSKASQPHPVYCTFPRKSASALFSSRKSESRAMASSFTGGTLPVPIKSNTEDPREGSTSHRSSPCSSESDREGSKVVAILVPVVPETGEGVENGKTVKSTSVDKKPLPFLERAMSCPSGVPLASTGRDERGKCFSYGNKYASVITPRPWERVIRPLERASSLRGGSLTKRSQQNEGFPGGAEKDSRAAAPGTGGRPLSNEDPFPSDMSGKESGKTVQKFKMTSTLSVSSDEANVKCLEVVSVYYTLPRQQSQKLGHFLQEFTQHMESLTEPPVVRTESSQDPIEDEPKGSAPEQSGSPSPEDLTMQVGSAHRGHHLSQTAVKTTDLPPARSGASRAFLPRMASFEAEASFQKGDSKTRQIVPDPLQESDAQSTKERGEALESKTLQPSSGLRGKLATEENSDHRPPPIKSGSRGPSELRTCSEGNIGNSPVATSSEECAGSDIASRATGRAGYVQEDDRASGSQLREVRGQTGTRFQKQANTAPCDLQSQVIALTPALHKLQLGQASSEPDIESLQFEPREISQRSQEVNRTGNQEAQRETQKLVWNQPLFPGGSNQNETSLEDQEREQNRPSVKHRLAAMSKANRNFPAKVLSPRRHVATIFPQRQNSSDLSGLSLDMPECNPQSPEPTPKSTDSREENRLSHDGTDAEISGRALQVTVLSNRETSMHLSNQKSNSISPPPQDELKDISEPPPKCENSEETTNAQPLDREPVTPASPTFTNLGAADFFDPPLPLKATLESSIRPVSYQQQQQRHASSLEWEPEPNPYRSKSLKSVRLQGYGLRKSQPPRVRERHFSENTSLDNALSRLTLREEFPTKSGYNRRFKSFSELSSFDENESWTMYSDRPDTGPRSATSISRPIDYGIFGKEQQLAFLENVKRSLTQGRLWKPSFLKNPGFLKDEIINPENPGESSSSKSPSSQVPEEVLSPSPSLNIYEEDTADSDCDTDTTTDDEYYLDENDKESEL
ncbi:exophilin-5 [Sorex fumeus]|uniref:exophilin-5 n=1 Tax=Sorex fumeus TaxID=62283 RepID=UPI0024ADD49B|nr:exophilin-5 [Sorex fumeus]